MSLIEIVIASGKSSVDIALYTLLPVMVVMLCLMKVLEAMGVMAIIVKMLTPVLKPFGLTGMSTFAMVQMNLISFAAPLATLAIMLSRGVSDRHLVIIDDSSISAICQPFITEAARMLRS